MPKLIPALLLLATLPPATAAVINFQQNVSPSGTYEHLGQDFRAAGGVNNGAQMLVGIQGNVETPNHAMRSVLGFDLSAIPAGSTINSISLRLVSDGGQVGTIAGVGVINLHQLTPNGDPANALVEGQASFVNWKAENPWTTSGGDYDSTPMSTSVLDNTNDNTALDPGETATFGSTAAFLAAAQFALDNGIPLQFILIAPTAEAATTSNNFFRFRSDDFATAADRPLLTIDYTIPEPSSSMLCALAAGAALGLRRRSARAV